MELLFLILAPVALILLVPVRIRLSGDFEEDRLEAAGRVALGFGALTLRASWVEGILTVRPVVLGFPVWTLRPGGGAPKVEKPRPGEGEDPETEDEASAKVQKGWRERLDGILEYDRRFRTPVLRFLRRLPRVIRFRRLAVDGRYGGDTAEATGCLFGYVRAVDVVTSDRLRLDVAPDFRLSGFRGSIRADLTFHLARLLSAALLAAAGLGRGYLILILRRRFGKRRRSAAQAA
jgi:hypothetical protein